MSFLFYETKSSLKLQALSSSVFRAHTLYSKFSIKSLFSHPGYLCLWNLKIVLIMVEQIAPQHGSFRYQCESQLQSPQLVYPFESGLWIQACLEHEIISSSFMVSSITPSQSLYHSKTFSNLNSNPKPQLRCQWRNHSGTSLSLACARVGLRICLNFFFLDFTQATYYVVHILGFYLFF